MTMQVQKLYGPSDGFRSCPHTGGTGGVVIMVQL